LSVYFCTTLSLTSEVPFSAAADGVRVAVRLSPRARADRLDGIARLADGAAFLKVSVTAPPAENRANEWRVPRRDLAVVGGKKSRSKIVHVAGEPTALMQRLGAALASLAKS
jgi:uncharacterized protein YggU (UPF0235/DUF167 family)